MSFMPDGSTPIPATAAPAAPAAPAQADPALVEQIRNQTLNEIFGGKYKTPEAAKAGYWEQNKYIGQLESLVGQSSAATAQAPPDPFKRLADESLIPIDAFQQGVQAIVAKELANVFGPITGALQARDSLVASFPQYAADEQKVLAFANSRPELSQKVQQMTAAGFPLEALKLQYTEFLQAHPPVSTPAPDPKAGLPGTPGSDPSRQPDVQAAQQAEAQRLMSTIQYALQTKDENPMWNEVFKDFKVKLPPGFQQGT